MRIYTLEIGLVNFFVTPYDFICVIRSKVWSLCTAFYDRKWASGEGSPHSKIMLFLNSASFRRYDGLNLDPTKIIRSCHDWRSHAL